MFQATFTSKRDAADVFQGFKNWSQAERAATTARFTTRVQPCLATNIGCCKSRLHEY